ncbi:carbon-nitrogen hydrolase [Gongronella butleri]|nr:carbon-nitrogen hydrolase [Gongronella butleri]
MPTLRVALVQLFIDHKSRSANWTNAKRYIEHAAREKCELVVFPEFFLGGPGRKTVTNDAKSHFISLAQKHGIDIVPGTLIESDSDGKLRNTAYYIDKSGNVLLKYDKVNLYPQERRYLQPGQPTFPTCQTRFGVTVGLCVCWDLAVPEVTRHLAMKGHAQLVLVPAYWTFDEQPDAPGTYDADSELNVLRSLCTARAFENETCIAFCNAAQRPRADTGNDEKPPPPFGVLAGASQVTVPFKGAIAQAKSDREEMLIVDIDVPKATADAESIYLIRETYAKGLTKPRL